MANSVISLNETVECSLGINYEKDDDKYMYIFIRKIEMLQKLLMKNDPWTKILIVGEGNFTQTLALAVLRESPKGITSTQYEIRSQTDTVSAKTQCLEEAKTLALKNANPECVKRIMDIAWCMNELNILFGVDATSAKSCDLSQYDSTVVWFQCPWSIMWDDILPLITNFLKNMAKQQKPGDYVLIGIANKPPYTWSYMFQKWLFKLDGQNVQIQPYLENHYNFKGADCEFIKTLLKYGYTHKALRKNIHKKIENHHATLIFERNSNIFI